MAKKKAAKSEEPAAAADQSFGLQWLFWFRFADASWFGDRAATDLIVDALAGTAWWKELEVAGRNSMPGKALGSPDDLKTLLAGGGRGMTMLARGAPRAAAFTVESECTVKIDLMAGYFSFGAGASGEVLKRLGRAAIDDILEVGLRFSQAWRKSSHLQEASAFPYGRAADRYPRTGPKRSGPRPMGAVVDIVDPTYEPYDPQDNRVQESRAIAGAAVPPGVTRAEHDGIVVLRWTDDPSALEPTMEASRRHEEWLGDLLAGKG